MDKAYAHDEAILQCRTTMQLRYLVLDTETTEAKDPEVCQVAYVWEGGEFCKMVRPVSPITPEAAAIHGITNEMVAGAYGIEVFSTQMFTDFLERIIVGYNVQFDLKALKTSFNRHNTPFEYTARRVFDMMYCYAAFYGEINPRYGTFKWQSLTDALNQCGLPFTGQAHDALSDAKTTLQLMRYIADQKTTWEDALDVASKMLQPGYDNYDWQEEFVAAVSKITYRK